MVQIHLDLVWFLLQQTTTIPIGFKTDKITKIKYLDLTFRYYLNYPGETYTCSHLALTTCRSNRWNNKIQNLK